MSCRLFFIAQLDRKRDLFCIALTKNDKFRLVVFYLMRYNVDM